MLLQACFSNEPGLIMEGPSGIYSTKYPSPGFISSEVQGQPLNLLLLSKCLQVLLISQKAITSLSHINHSHTSNSFVQISLARVSPLRLQTYCCVSWMDRWMFGWMKRKTEIALYLSTIVHFRSMKMGSHFHRTKTVTVTILVEQYCISVTEIINQITFYDG